MPKQLRTYIYPCAMCECINLKADKDYPELVSCTHCGNITTAPSEADEIHYQEQLQLERTGTN